MKFERFIARRYLFSGQHKALVSAITIISVLGVAVGVFALIVVLAVMQGFTANLIEKIMGAYAHIDITPQTQMAVSIPSNDVMTTLSEVRGVKAVAPLIQRMALVQVAGTGMSGLGSGAPQSPLLIQGIDLEREQRVTTLMRSVDHGTSTPGDYELVMGERAARDLGVMLGSRLTVFSSRIVRTANGPVPAIRSVQLVGTFKTGYPQIDSFVGYTGLDAARELFVLPEHLVDSWHVTVDDPERAKSIAAEIHNVLGKDFRVQAWQDRDPTLFSALVLEKWAMFIILLLIVLVAAFNIIGTLIMVVVEKTREIGILKSMGAKESAILRVFLYQGMLIGGIGTSLGAVAGLFLCYLLKYHVKINIMSEAYLTDRIPLLIDPRMEVIIIVSSLLICLAASLYPARQAAKLDPIEALRYE